MERCGELGALDYVRLMADYLCGSLDAEHYTKTFFAYNKRRVILPGGTATELILRAHGDAEDYEPDPELRSKNPGWIDECQLRDRVQKSLRELESLGYRLKQPEDPGERNA